MFVATFSLYIYSFLAVLSILAEHRMIQSNMLPHKNTNQSHPPIMVSPRTILIIDDDLIVSHVIVRVLSQAGFRVIAANGGRLGLELLRSHTNEVECVLLDLAMPMLDGEQVLATIRQLQPDLPVVAMSGYIGEDIYTRLKSGGITALLPKPFTPGELVNAIESVLQD